MRAPSECCSAEQVLDATFASIGLDGTAGRGR